jgi:hypothetical protein
MIERANAYRKPNSEAGEPMLIRVNPKLSASQKLGEGGAASRKRAGERTVSGDLAMSPKRVHYCGHLDGSCGGASQMEKPGAGYSNLRGGRGPL